MTPITTDVRASPECRSPAPDRRHAMADDRVGQREIQSGSAIVKAPGTRLFPLAAPIATGVLVECATG